MDRNIRVDTTTALRMSALHTAYCIHTKMKADHPRYRGTLVRAVVLEIFNRFFNRINRLNRMILLESIDRENRYILSISKIPILSSECSKSAHESIFGPKV